MDLNSPENRKLKNAIKDFELPLDKEQLWAGIQQKKSKRRLGFWMWPGLVMGLILGFFVFKMDYSQDTVSESNVKLDQPLVDKITNNPINEKSKKSNQKNLIKKDDNIEIPKSKALSNTNEIQNRHERVEEAKPNFKNSLQKIDPLNQESATLYSNSNEGQGALKKVEKVAAFKVNDGLTDLPKQIFTSNNQNTKTSDTSNANAQNQTEKDEPEITKLIKKPSRDNKEVNKVAEINYQIQLKALPTLFTNLELSNNSFSINEKLPLILSSNLILPQKKTKIFTTYLTGGVGFTSGQISSRLLEPSSGFPNEAKVKSLETTSSSVLLRLNLNRKFSLLTGISYHQSNERLQYIENVDQTVFLDSVLIRETIDGAGNVQRIYGAGVGISTTRYNYTIYNKYKSIDIPLLASYDHYIGKLGLHFEAGVLANMKFNFKGRTPITLDEISNGDGAFKSSLGLRYLLGLGLDYPLTNKWIITMRPTYVFGEDDIRTIESSFKQGLEFFKVEFGVGYRF